MLNIGKLISLTLVLILERRCSFYGCSTAEGSTSPAREMNSWAREFIEANRA